MKFDQQQPIFLQIARGIEDAILSGAFAEESQLPSITEFSVTYQINPATALKGINLLVDSGAVYKKRGLGMFVKQGATEQLRAQRRESFYEQYAKPLIAEADRLSLTRRDVIAMIERGMSAI